MDRNALNGVKRVLILGNTGFIGSYFQRHCQENWPAVEVLGFSSSDIDLSDTQQAGTLKEVFDPSTVVVMCAMIKKEYGDNLDSYAKNMQMAVNICRVAGERPVKKFLYISSTAVYGEDVHNTSITEKTAVCPTSYYGMAKYASERLLMKSIAPESLAILRPPLIYGPKDRSLAYGPAGFTKKAIGKELITLWGDGTELREFVYIDDLIRAMEGLLRADFSGVVNVVSGRSYSFKDVLDVIARLWEGDLNVSSRARTKAKADNCFQNSFFGEQLPGFSFTPLEKGIAKIIGSEMSAVK